MRGPHSHTGRTFALPVAFPTAVTSNRPVLWLRDWTPSGTNRLHLGGMMEERKDGDVVILVPEASSSEESGDEADFEMIFRRLIAAGNRRLVINCERLPRPWAGLPALLTAMAAVYLRGGGRIAACGARPPDDPGVIRDTPIRFKHFNSEGEAVVWLRSQTP